VTNDQHTQLAQHIGKVLRDRRNELGLSIERVAGLADMTANALWLNENGRRIPNGATLLKLAHALKIEDQPLSIFAKLEWEPMGDGFPGMRLVVKNGATREYVHAA
jgi:transcriptional regulator with XRE-family HTH domain